MIDVLLFKNIASGIFKLFTTYSLLRSITCNTRLGDNFVRLVCVISPNMRKKWGFSTSLEIMTSGIKS